MKTVEEQLAEERVVLAWIEQHAKSSTLIITPNKDRTGYDFTFWGRGTFSAKGDLRECIRQAIEADQ